MLQCLQIAQSHIKDNFVGFLASEEKEIKYWQCTLLRQTLSE